MKKTYKELRKIVKTINDILQRDKNLEQTKFWYAVRKFRKLNVEPIDEERNEKLADEQLNQALVDAKTQEVLKDEKGNYKFSKDGIKNLNDFLRKFEENEYEVTPYISSFVPDGLLEEEVELLKGIVL